MIKSRVLSVHFLLVILIITFFYSLRYVEAYKRLEEGPDLEGVDFSILENAMNISTIKRHMMFFSSLRTRAVGYPGNWKAAKYIHDKFIEYGLKGVVYQQFSVVDAVDKGSNITIHETGQTLRLYPLRPNLVCTSQTPPAGISGPLIYVRDGWMEDFEAGSKEAKARIEGSIVLMDWYTENRWITALKFGAKAVIFLPPPVLRHGVSGALHVKHLPELPLHFPRYYIDEYGAKILLQNLGKKVTIRSNHKWIEVTSWNVIGYVEGKEHPDHIILVSAYYDSSSIAPSYAPGAEESASVSSLLEISKYFSKHPAKNTLMFVAFSGHHNGLRGAVAFASEYFSYSKWLKNPQDFIGLKIKLNVNLDLSLGSPVLYFVAQGNEFRYFGGDTTWAGIYINVYEYFKKIIEKVMDEKPFGQSYKEPEYNYYLTGGYYRSESEGRILAWKDFIYDHEALWACFVPAYTISTAYDCRPQYEEPFDTMEWIESRVNGWNNLKSQLEIAIPIIYVYANEDEIEKAYKGWWEREEPSSYFLSIVGRVGIYRKEKAYYEPIPNAIVYLRTLVGNERTGYYYKRIFTLADKDGRFRVYPVFSRYYAAKSISAWVLDEKTGRILYATDMGMHRYMPLILPGVLPYGDFGWFVVFKASSLVFDTFVSSRYLRVYIQDLKTQPESWSEWSWGGLTVLFVPPNKRIEVTWFVPPDRYPYAILNNASKTHPLGRGYELRPGEQLIISYASLKYAECLYWANEKRFQIVAESEPEILVSNLYKEHTSTEQIIKMAYNAIRRKSYSEADALIREARHLAAGTYGELRSKIEDAVAVVPIIAALLLPFVFLTEKLIFSARGPKRVISFIGTFAFILGIFYFIHPGFRLAASPLMIIIGFSTMILSIPILIMAVNSISSYMNKVRLERLGRHEVEVSRISELNQAFITGIENMRRMKLRTLLTLVTILIMVSSLISVASISTLRVNLITRAAGGVANYQGVYLRKVLWGEGSYDLGDGTYQLIKEWYGDNASIAPRAWRYSAFYSSLGSYPQRVGFKLCHGDKWLSAMVLWGLSSAEKEVLKIEDLMRAGRWFEAADKKAIIINEWQASKLGINETDVDKGPVPVVFEGMRFYVIGIVDRVIMERLMEMDGERVTPLKFDLDINPFTIHVEMNYCFILPFKEVLNLGGGIASISIMFERQEDVENAARRISSMFPSYLTYFTRRDEETGELTCYMLSETNTYTLLGFEFHIIPLAIVVLAIFNIVMGSVYERRREISTYSIVGLSPLHIAVMFLAESIVYAIIGGMIGYLAAMILSRLVGVIIPVGLISRNYSSNWVMMALGLSMGSTILASAYPAWVASRLVTPSLERAWKIPTKPLRDLWEIPLPFYAVKDEAEAILEYIWEYMDAHTAPDAPDFSIKKMKPIKGEIEDKRYIGLEAEMRLGPYEAGIAQETRFYMVEDNPGRWSLHIIAKRTMGPRDRWKRMNRHYVDLIRKQLLLWRSLPPSERRRYTRMNKKPKVEG